MKIDKIIQLVREGFLEKDIGVYTTAGMFKGKWYAVDTHVETIEIQDGNVCNIINISNIIAISYLDGDTDE